MITTLEFPGIFPSTLFLIPGDTLFDKCSSLFLSLLFEESHENVLFPFVDLRLFCDADVLPLLGPCLPQCSALMMDSVRDTKSRVYVYSVDNNHC